MKFFKAEQGSLRRDLAILALAFGALFFQFLGRLPLIDPDEGRYIEIPREMLERGDFVTPTLNYVKYFEKPPLHYWLNALSLSVFGENEFAARFAGTLCGLLTVLLTYYLARRLFDRRTALCSATILGTAGGFLLQSRINFTDMTLTFCLSTAFAFFLLAERDGAEHRGRDYYLFYAFMALAVLAKGLIGIVLPGGVILFYLVLTRRWRTLREMRLLSGGALFLAICAPWFVLVSLRNPEFPYFFFIHEHFQRFLTNVHNRYQPPWFFIPVLAGTMLPWSLFIPAALRKGWRERGSREILFLLLWAGVIFAFFSKSSSKLIPYILPVFPPLALLMGKWFAETFSTRPLRLWGTATGLLLLLCGSVVAGYPLLTTDALLTVRDGALVGGLLIGEGVVALIAARKGESLTLCGSLALTATIFALFGPPVVYQRVEVDVSAKELARVINQQAGKEARVASFDAYQQGIPFYTHRRVIVVGNPDELEFGSKQGDHSAWFMDRPSFLKLWEGPDTLFTVVKKRDLPALEASTVAPRLVATAGNRLLVCNKPAPLPQPSPLPQGEGASR